MTRTGNGQALIDKAKQSRTFELNISAELLVHAVDAIEAEVRFGIAATVAKLEWMQPGQIETMGGERRDPRTPADYVELYRSAVLAVISGVEKS